MSALVSICIPTYRRPDLLREAIESCLSQSYPDFEILVGDDSPDDATEALVRSFAGDSRVRYHRNRPGRGQAANVEGLFARATGGRVVLLHDDDLLLPTALRDLDEAWREGGGVSVVYGKQHVLSRGEIRPEDSEALNASYYRTAAHAGVQRSALWAAIVQQFPNDGYMLSAELAARMRLLDSPACDFELGIQLARAGGVFRYVDRYTSVYRVTEGSISETNQGRTERDSLRVLAALEVPEELRAARRERMRRLGPAAVNSWLGAGYRGEAWRAYLSEAYPPARRFSPRGIAQLLLLLGPARLSRTVLGAKPPSSPPPEPRVDPERAEWHIVTGEYPPRQGGVADYTYQVARGLAARGARVHVWLPAWNPDPTPAPGVETHREMGRLLPADLRRLDRLLEAYPGPRRLLVQWVPHGFGMKSLNLPFCLWLARRAKRHGDRVEVMVHEPFLPFSARSWRVSAAAATHRVMTMVLLRAASEVWVSTPAWVPMLRRYAGRRRLGWRWLPIPSNIPVVEDAEGTASLRARYGTGSGPVLGHFGTYPPDVVELLEPALLRLLAGDAGRSALLIGRGGERLARALASAAPGLAPRVHVAEGLDAREVSLHLRACDVMLQPYRDGVNTRRTTMMAALAHGLPTVTTAGKHTEPVWRETDAVALAESETGEAIALRAEELLADPERRGRMARAAEALYREHFDLALALETLASSHPAR